ncbi:hypothetical protein HY025_03260 [Candidatus Daviesbacteria bacterium]|nr:hypothetical protein [Candidatus Daviesbacteria bacterium]
MKKLLTKDQKKLRRRILDITFQAKTAHLGSCLSVIDILDSIYKIKKKQEKFVLSNGHAAVGLYVVLEKYGFLKNPSLGKLKVHPHRDEKKGIDVSTGSLGQGLPIGVGMALADRKNRVYCVISDGECSEGSIWEAFRIAVEQKLENLIVVLNANGWSAYDRVNLKHLAQRLKSFDLNFSYCDGHDLKKLALALKKNPQGRPLLIFAKTTVSQLPFLKDQDALYYVMNEKDYHQALKILQ